MCATLSPKRIADRNTFHLLNSGAITRGGTIMTQALAVVFIWASSIGLTYAIAKLIRDVLRARRRLQLARQATEVTLEVPTRDGAVQQVTVNPDDEGSIRRFLDTVGASEPVAR